MNSLFNKKSALSIVVVLALIFAAGCSNSSKTSGNNTNTNNKATSSVSDSNTNKSSSSSGNADTNQQNNSQKELLENIKALALQGKVVNCDYPAKSTTCDTIETDWGKEDSHEWISEAKGTYYTYSKHNVVFGCNKGDQVFEIRSFDSQLGTISISDVENYFGKPEHDAKTNDEEIIGYVISKDFKIEFVFPLYKDNTKTPMLKHYNILYPDGTINNMSGDAGRQW